MKTIAKILRRAALPLAVFIVVALVHFCWLNVFPEQNPAQSRWATVLPVEEPSWINRYVDGQNYWLGYSYALSLAFAAVAFRRYREKNSISGKTFALGGITFSGFLAFAGCFMLGCCGSPMLAVYLSLFGAGFLPLAKPLIAVLTVIFVGTSWWWMSRSKPGDQFCEESGEICSCCGPEAPRVQEP
ncbi:MAG: hypothetical protein ACLQPD_26690 [Desulfomonilaceae bacterium]